jgi:hypothetical protein
MEFPIVSARDPRTNDARPGGSCASIVSTVDDRDLHAVARKVIAYTRAKNTCANYNNVHQTPPFAGIIQSRFAGMFSAPA